MNFSVNNIKSYLSNFLRPQNVLNTESVNDLKKDRANNLIEKLKRYRKYKVEMRIDAFDNAVTAAEDPLLPDREQLLSFYKQAMRDPHLRSLVRTNILKIIGSPFALYKKGTDEIDLDATMMFQSPWFESYRYHFHESELWGTTLIHFPKTTPSRNKKYADLEFAGRVEVVPREHVKPETGDLLIDLSHSKGIPYREEPWNSWFMEIGDPNDLGLLVIATKYVIFKNYSLGDWSRYIEKYGFPILAIKTATENEAELAKIEEMAANFGSNLWMIGDDQDEIDIKERTHNKGYEVFIDFIKYCEEKLAVLIGGQTGSIEEKAYVGSAQVHERILNEYMEAGVRREIYHINGELFPFLEKNGYKLDGLEYRYVGYNTNSIGDTSKNEDIADIKAKFDAYGVGVRAGAITPQRDDEEVFRQSLGIPNIGKEAEKAWKDDEGVRRPITLKMKEEGAEQAKPASEEPPEDSVNFTEPSAQVSAEGVGMTLTARVNGLYHSCCETLSAELQLTNLDKLARAAAERVFDKKLSGKNIDKKLWQETVGQLIDGINSGYGRSISGVKYGSPDHQLLLQYRYNVQVFAAFKNHHNTNELVNALIDENGNIRSKSAFKKAAGLVNSKYNKNWISTEYNQAVLAARNGYRWRQIEERSNIFPTVEYVGVADDNQSQICKDLDGGVWKWDDPILDTIAPSNHWGCRSFLKSSKKEPAPKTSGEQVKKAFKNNPGKTGDPFTKDHPYYKLQDQYKDAAQRLFGITSLITHNLDRFRSNVKQLELLDGKQHKIQTYKESGGFVATHKNADANDLSINSKAAEVLAKDKGHGVIIREHVEDGTPNPELMVDQVLSDVKSPIKPYTLDNRVKDAIRRQNLDNVVWNVKGTPSLNDMENGLRRAFHNRGKLSYVDIVYKDKTTRITRKMFDNGVILKELELIWK